MTFLRSVPEHRKVEGVPRGAQYEYSDYIFDHQDATNATAAAGITSK
jgi:hypothetical protein